jgi:hypothetical protein
LLHTVKNFKQPGLQNHTESENDVVNSEPQVGQLSIEPGGCGTTSNVVDLPSGLVSQHETKGKVAELCGYNNTQVIKFVDPTIKTKHV